METRKNIKKHEAKLDVAVLMIFFCRPNTFARVFEQVKNARPKRLYLYQDGPRVGHEDDMKLIMQCRNIVSDENIDWDCEVHRFYQEKNVGVDPSGYIADRWMFRTEEKGIILEDDCVPNHSFFRFCDELLEKYKNDSRVSFISGRNNAGISKELNTSYTFVGDGGSIWGWATWKRLVDTWDEQYNWLDDKEKLKTIRQNIKNQPFEMFVRNSEIRRQEGIAYFETILEAALCLNGGLYIVPKCNLIQNVGMTENAAHNVGKARLLSKRVRWLMELSAFEMHFPLNHPLEVEENKGFKPFRSLDPHPVLSQIGFICRIIRYDGIRGIMKRICKRAGK